MPGAPAGRHPPRTDGRDGGVAVSRQHAGARARAFFRLPPAPLTRLRLLFLVVGLVVAEQVQAALLADDRGDPRVLLAGAALAWACWQWFRGYRQGASPLPWLVPECAVFLALGALAGPERGLLILAAGLWLRSLYGTLGRVALGLAAYFGAYLGGTALVGAAGPAGLDPLIVGGAMALGAVVAHLLATMLGHYGQALDRAGLVVQAGAALAGAAGREEVYRAALLAALAVAGRPEARAALSLGPDEGLGEVAAAGAARPFPGPMHRCLLRLASAPAARPVAPALRVLAGAHAELALPLPGPDGPLGRLTLSSRTLPPPAARDALAAVAAQAALALARVGLLEELERRDDDARFRSLVQHASDVITVVAGDGIVRYQARSVARVFGYRPAELVGRPLTQVLHPDDAAQAAAFLAHMAGRRHVGVPVEWRWRHRDGSWRYAETVATNLLDDPNVGGLVLTTRDISERKRHEQQLAEQAERDALTGLANRARFRSRVEAALARGDDRAPVSVLYLDLDNFKAVNDRLGHAAGDALLLAAAGRLRACMRDGNTPARLGGDEFAVLWEAGGPPEGAAQLAERIVAALSAPFSLGGRQVAIGTSVGIAAAVPAESADELLHRADLAMYAAKRQGKGRVAHYEPGMQVTAGLSGARPGLRPRRWRWTRSRVPRREAPAQRGAA